MSDLARIEEELGTNEGLDWEFVFTEEDLGLEREENCSKKAKVHEDQ
jgi:hypothetical protein